MSSWRHYGSSPTRPPRRSLGRRAFPLPSPSLQRGQRRSVWRNAALSWRVWFGLAWVALVLSCGCKQSPKGPAPTPQTTVLRVYAISTLAGALEPCGCRKDMLGGVDHAAALLARPTPEVAHRLVVGAGPMLFMNPELEDDKRQQDLWKAQAIAEAMRDWALVAWAPGVNDWAGGDERLAELAAQAEAALLAGNLAGSSAPVTRGKVVHLGDTRVGLVGVSSASAWPKGVTQRDPVRTLREGLEQVQAEGAQLTVALVAAPRGEALRLVEQVPGFHLAVVGKSSDRGEGNDAPSPPVWLERTLVIQAPNHLQGVSFVDLHVKDGNFQFEDGSGIQRKQRRESVERRIEELSHRIQRWQQEKTVSERDLQARREDLVRLQSELAELQRPEAQPKGSFVRYQLVEVREDLGSDPQVSSRMNSYYKKVNEHNRVAFKDRRPPPLEAGQAGYVGVERCATCHEPAYRFWKKTPHARAYETLERQHKEFNLDCVGCHVTGYEKPGGSTVAFVEGLKDVQCENCHGPGSRHAVDRQKASIERNPTPAVCESCHHPPHVADDWMAVAVWSKLLGPGHGLPLPPSPPPQQAPK